MFDDNLTTTQAASSLLPVAPEERIDSLDVMRGAAMSGVLVAYTVWNLGGPPSDTYSTADQIIEFVLTILIDSKAYTLLAFLFGVGFSIQLRRAEDREIDLVPLYRRRLFALMLIGVAHAVLLRNGDILVPYAAMGFMLLLFRKASDGALLTAAIVSTSVPFIARWIWELSGMPFPLRPETEGMGHLAANFEWIKYWYATAITSWPHSLPMFFAGLYVGRWRILENISAHKKGLRRVLVAGLVLGAGMFAGRLAIMRLTVESNGPTAFVNVALTYLWNVHAWGLAAFYGSTWLLLLQRRSWQKLMSPLAAVGRMALTNYLLQAIIIVPICIAFGLYDNVKPGFGLMLALLVFLVQVPASVLWLRHFRFGPAEWLWRSLTYKTLQPMRLVIESAPSGTALHAME
jgi:uncharacterized protein